MTRYLPLLLFTVSLCFVQSSKILFVFPFTSYSHFTPGFRLAKELAHRGHQVTMINPYPQKTPIKNFREVSVENIAELMTALEKHLFAMDKLGSLGNMHFAFKLGAQLTEQTLRHENVQKLLTSGESFDLLVVENFLDDALVGLGHYFKAPVVFVPPGACGVFNNHLFGNPAPSSYVPYAMGTFSTHMNFWQRIQNLLLNVVTDLMREFIYMPKQRELFKKYIASDIKLDDLLYNVSLMLTNSHVSFSGAFPHVPSIIEIGGYHIDPPQKLPADLQKFLDDAKEGVILFSMGSNIKSKNLTPKIRSAVLKVFEKLKQKVLWKYELDLPDVPENVKIMKWIPQEDVLAHPNIKVFISHGGLLSSIETVYYGVPVIGVPVFGDQRNNVAAAVDNGYAIALSLDELNEEKLSWALNEILNNPKYRENVKHRSRLMRDQPMKPLDVAIYWIEHVIRYRGAPHLRSAALDLKWYQVQMLDIAIVLAIVTVMLFSIIYIIIKKILGFCIEKKKPIVSNNKKNK